MIMVAMLQAFTMFTELVIYHNGMFTILKA